MFFFSSLFLISSSLSFFFSFVSKASADFLLLVLFFCPGTAFLGVKSIITDLLAPAGLDDEEEGEGGGRVTQLV